MILAALTLHAVITGAVYGPGGKPLPNVRVTASRPETPREQNARLIAGTLERKAVATAMTD
ncbi:MAG TPA: hypothetical protein VN181_12805, partial [Thermoanaerobaculia bacterium]|nr:hypothetical protein [Thermoanaerobaculia bacterium]